MIKDKSTILFLILIFAFAILPGCINQETPGVSLTGTSIVSLKEEVYIKGLRVPWAIDIAPDGRIFISERTGNIRIVENGGLIPIPWISLDVAATGEGGLLGLALDPDFKTNGYIYAAHTYRYGTGNLKNRLVRLRDTDAGGVLNAILLDGINGNTIHDGGRVKIGPDGKIYWTTGDAGQAQLAQDLSSLNGKILRLNLDGTVPEDNPFPGSPVYSYGHRNPEGLAWQPSTGILYATEHGSSATDELNLIVPGNNYGWPVIRGEETQPGMVKPVIQSGSDTWAPAGATFINGGEWNNFLLFTGLRGESLFKIGFQENNPSKIVSFERLLRGKYGRLRDVIQGPDNCIYIATSNIDGRGSPGPGRQDYKINVC